MERKSYKKNYRKKVYKGKKPNTYRKKTFASKKRFTTPQKAKTSQDYSGFDKAIYKTDKIISQVGHGFDVLGKPLKGLYQLAKDINPFKLFSKGK